MADVLVTWLRWGLVAATAIKALDIGVLSGNLLFGLAFAAAGVLLALRERVGGTALAVVSVAASVAGIGSNHVMLMAWLAASIGLFTGEDRLLVLRVQAVVLYFFAALNKVNPTFLAGDIITENAPWLPIPQAAAVATVVVEFWLAAAVWRRWRWAVPVAAGFHAAVLVPWLWPPAMFGRFLVFNGLAVLLVAAAVGRQHVFAQDL